MAVFADHGVSLSVYKIVCVCVGLGLSCRAWTTSVSLRKWLVKQLVLAKLSIMIPELVSCQYLVVVSQLCLKFHCVLLFGHLASKNHLPGFEKPHTGLLPIFRCSKASNLIAWCGMCFGRCDIGTVQTEDFTATSEQVSRPTLCAHWANEHEFGIQWGATKHPRLAGGFPESLVFLELVSLEPCLPGISFPEPWRNPQRILEPWVSGTETRWFIVTLSPPPVSDCSLTGPFWSWNHGFLANWFSGTLSVAWTLVQPTAYIRPLGCFRNLGTLPELWPCPCPEPVA